MDIPDKNKILNSDICRCLLILMMSVMTATGLPFSPAFLVLSLLVGYWFFERYNKIDGLLILALIFECLVIFATFNTGLLLCALTIVCLAINVNKYNSSYLFLSMSVIFMAVSSLISRQAILS